jgi:hypothetical protein
VNCTNNESKSMAMLDELTIDEIDMLDSHESFRVATSSERAKVHFTQYNGAHWRGLIHVLDWIAEMFLCQNICCLRLPP